MKQIPNFIIYQLALRSFTPEGTLNAAKLLLPHVASLGVDIVYICPFCVADDDDEIATWEYSSDRIENGKSQKSIQNCRLL